MEKEVIQFNLMQKKLYKFIPLIFVIIVAFVPLFDLFHSGLPLTHDGQDHVARIANFYLALQDGSLIPRWGANLNWGFGHPVLMFLYPFPSYIASLFHFLGFSLVDSLKLVFGLSFIASGIGMFFWINRLIGAYAGVLAAILYMFAPYRFVNLYVRGAIGEHVSFAFIPFVLFFITKLFLEKNNSIKFISLITSGIALFTAGLILSHNALSMLFLAFALAYTLVLYFYNRNLKKLIFTFAGVVYGFLLSAFFWIPAYIEGKYTLRDIVTGGNEYADRFVISPLEFFAPSWSYGITGQLSVQIGLVHIILIILGIYAIYKLRKKEKLNSKVFLITFLFFILSLFMMLKESNFIWSAITTLQKFQFPWRFLSLTVLTSSVLGAYSILLLKKENKKIIGIVIIFLSIILFYGTYWRANGFLSKENAFFNDIYYSTTDTGESSPIWSIRFMEEEPKAHIEILNGKALIQETFRSSVRHEYIVLAENKTRIKENTLYFPGWNVYINDRKLDTSTEVEFQDELHRGVMTFYVETGESKVKLIFEDTKLRTVSNIISLCAFVVLILLLIYLYLIKKNNEKNIY